MRARETRELKNFEETKLLNFKKIEKKKLLTVLPAQVRMVSRPDLLEHLHVRVRGPERRQEGLGKVAVW